VCEREREVLDIRSSSSSIITFSHHKTCARAMVFSSKEKSDEIVVVGSPQTEEKDKCEFISHYLCEFYESASHFAHDVL
jgi:hypothetical protein